MVQNIVVDSEFKNLIPPLQETEFQQLETSILSEGCRDALVLWKGQDILVDGHNRFEICQKHSLPYQVIEREFDNRSQVAEWMLRNQLGRRNLTDAARTQAAKRYKAIFEAEANKRSLANLKQNEESTERRKSDSREMKRTDEKLAELAGGMGKDKFRQADYVDEKAPETLKKRWEKDEVSTNRAYLITKALDQSPAEHREQIAELCGDSDEKVAILNRLYKSAGSVESNGTFYEILKAEGFHYGDKDSDWCDFVESSIQQIQRALDKVAEWHKRDAKNKKREEAVERGEAANETAVTLLLGDFREQMEAMEAESVDIIFTDPPYHVEHYPLWNALAHQAARVLKKGGLLISYCGSMAMFHAIPALNECLTPYAVDAILHKSHLQLFSSKRLNAWKPLLYYTNGKASLEHRWYADVLNEDHEYQETKLLHDWGQPISEAKYILNIYGKEGMTVLDPMSGSGTIPIAAALLGFNGIGIELNYDNLMIAKDRAAQLLGGSHDSTKAA